MGEGIVMILLRNIPPACGRVEIKKEEKKERGLRANFFLQKLAALARCVQTDDG